VPESESPRQIQARPEHLVIRLAERRFAIALDRVDSVAIAPPINLVPGTPPCLRGLVNYQGTILPAVDPMPDLPGDRRHLVVLTSVGYGRFALLCDWIEDLAESSEDATALDPDRVAQEVATAFAAIAQKLPEAAKPVARIVPRRPPKTG
jgi:chemotaxis signal transduction protein